MRGSDFSLPRRSTRTDVGCSSTPDRQSARPKPTFAGRPERLPQTERSHYDRCRRLRAARARSEALRERENAMSLARRRFLSLAGGAVAAPMLARSASSQAYPTRPVRVIVPLAAGGPTDVFARLIAQKLSDSTGKQFYVENIAGAGSNIGMGRAAQAAPDGYTALVAAFNYIVNPALYDKVPYDPKKSFDPVTLATSTSVLLAVNPSVPAQTVDDLIALIKANPRKYNYASGGGVGSPGHLTGEQFRLSLG